MTIMVAVCATGLFSSCMTLFSSSRQTIMVNRDSSEQMTIITADDTLSTSEQSTEISVRKKHLNHPIQFISEQNVYQELIPGRRIDEFAFMADLCLDGVGLPIDFATCKIYRPACTTYHIASVSRDSCTTLPVSDHRLASPWKPRSQKLYHHELRIAGSLGNAMHNHSYNKMYDRVCQKMHLIDDPEAFYCGLGAVVNASVSLSYFYHFNQRWAFGLIIGTGNQPYESLALDSTTPHQDQQGEASTSFAGDMYATSWYIIPAFKLHWAFFNNTRYYSKVALGAMNQHNWFVSANSFRSTQRFDERSWHPAYQFSPLGFEVGPSKMRFFAELGYGMEGVLTIGFSTFF